MAKSLRRIALFLAATTCLTLAQENPLPTSLSSPDSVQPNQNSAQSLGDVARRVRKDHSEETKITPDEAKKLFAAVDRLTSFASEDTGFPQHGTVKRQLLGPDDIEKFARSKMSKDEYAERFARAELTMKKIGLLPPQID